MVPVGVGDPWAQWAHDTTEFHHDSIYDPGLISYL